MKDIVLKNLEWDTKQLGFKCGLIDCSFDMEDQLILFHLIENLIKGADGNTSFITIKLSSKYTQVLNKLLKIGIKFIDTEVIFISKDVQLKQNLKSNIHFAKTFNPDCFVLLAEEMKWSRLFLDKRISSNAVLSLWKKSIRNHCMGRSDEIAIAIVDENPAGIVTINFENEEKIKLFIVGVLPEYQNAGVGTNLLEAILNKYGEKYSIYVETSSMNFPAQRLYQKAGFRLNSIRYILHYMN